MSIIFTVPQNHAVIITRFGKFSSIKQQGLRMKIPFVEAIHYVNDWGGVANKNSYEIELSEQIINTSPKECHSKDNVPVRIDASIYWRILNIEKAVFGVDHLPSSLIDTCLNALRAEIGKLTLDQLLTSRQSLSDKVSVSLKEISEKWGVLISRVEIQELETSDETAEAMRQEMTAERKKRADVLEAEGIALSKIKIAEAEASAIKLKASAEAEYILKLSATLGKDVVGQILLSEKVLDAYKAISNNPANKIFLPNNIQTLVTDQIQGGTL